MLGMALPSMLLGKSVLYVLLLLGITTGLLATKDESLRATMKLLLNSRVTALAVLLMGSLLVGVATGINPAFAVERWAEVAFVLLCAVALFMTFREMPGRHLEMLLKVLAISTVVGSVLALTDALIGDPRLSAALHGKDMALTPYRLHYMSSILAVIAPFVWARLMIKAREGEPFAIRVAAPVSLFIFMVAVVCGGRAGWVGVAAGLVTFLGLISRYHGFVIHKKHWVLGLIVAVLSVGLYAFSFGGFGVERVLIGRGPVWEQAFENIAQAPLFGIGVMNFRNLPGAVDMHPHNWLLQMLLEGGIVSTAIFIALVGLILWRFYGYAKGNIYGVAAMASLIAFLVAGLANTSIFTGWWMCFLIVSAMLGWRAGWGGVDLKKRRRTSQLVKS